MIVLARAYFAKQSTSDRKNVIRLPILFHIIAVWNYKKAVGNNYSWKLIFHGRVFINFTSAPSTLGDLAWTCFFSLDASDSDSDWLPDSEPESESLLPDWLLLPSLLLPELEPVPEPDADPESSSDWLQLEVKRLLCFVLITGLTHSDKRNNLAQLVKHIQITHS